MVQGEAVIQHPLNRPKSHITQACEQRTNQQKLASNGKVGSNKVVFFRGSAKSQGEGRQEWPFLGQKTIPAAWPRKYRDMEGKGKGKEKEAEEAAEEKEEEEEEEEERRWRKGGRSKAEKNAVKRKKKDEEEEKEEEEEEEEEEEGGGRCSSTSTVSISGAGSGLAACLCNVVVDVTHIWRLRVRRVPRSCPMSDYTTALCVFY
ncbi:uncharacterized protein MONBRDRAFT_27281 [Monosiga brevicollis MX1]|uniref:Uncharacterized protein n=1 Tax=Monosiga brevicollis TaxID=81824 RepID=A9V4U6_MONBE|nr:uncharacterized protein MONBRDRAFT_27281 [Monosiga brevicollis MX1]EDQ87430.1 predicted protein [Monosiga brevicollis MX1]|eukprot:XP_001747690.1 hypothetical protein [Monosiga brevicollis MX1]